jgi:transglutaminase-like putative cysteine protease
MKKRKTRSERFWQYVVKDWHDKALFLFLGIFLYQYAVWFDFYWLDETRPIVDAAFAATLLCAWVVPKQGWVRSIVTVTTVIYLTSRIVRPEPIRDLPDNLLAPFLYGLEYFLRLTPYVWFSIGVWAIYSIVYWYLNTKWRLFSVMMTSIVLFCVVDSFSLFRLWEQVAIMIGCGLIMLVIFHLKQLKTKDPEGYENLMSYPLPITVMIITIISATLALGVLAPNIRPIIMDPYTAWKTYQGEVVPAFSSGPGFAVFDSGSTQSGYSRNDENLGGAFNFDYSPVFTVDASRRSYWRGETRSLYNGAGWEETTVAERDNLVPLARALEYPGDPAVDTGLDMIEVTQTFNIIEGKSFPVLFGAPFAERVEPVTTDGGETFSLDRGFWEVRNRSILWAERPDFPYPESYMVTSSMPVIDEEKLKTAVLVSNPRRFREYLQLPESLPDRVVSLAAEVTAEAPSPYEKAKVLATYLSTTFPYTSEPDLTKRQSGDFVDSFLFEVQEGYCDYYSTAMVVMARTLGFPARWVKGYVPGQSSNELIYEQYLPEVEIDFDGPGTFTVRNSDAHSWAEVYFEGYGWIPFEPTAGFSLPIMEVENETEATLPIDLPSTETTAPSGEGGTSSMVRLITTAGVSAAAAGLLVYTAIRFQWLTLFRMRSFRKSPNYNLKFLADMERLLARFRRKGLTWAEHETLREMMMRWMKQHSWLKKDMEVLLLTFEKAKYSGARLTEEEYHHAEHRIKKLRESF